MISISSDLLMQLATGFMLVSLRIFGLFLVMPLFAFRSFPIRIRLMVTLLLALVVMGSLPEQTRSLGLNPPTFISAGIELAIGAFVGFLVRLGLLAVEIAAEVLSIQTGLSFATSYVRDINLASGLMGEFLGLSAIAIMFALGLHLLVIELVLESFRSLPFGQWPSVWSPQAVVGLTARSFQLGLVLAMPSIVVYLLFYVIQAVLARTSPQFNLFTVGFAITVPLAFLVLMIVLPDLPQFVARSMETPLQFIRSGLKP